MALSGSFDFVLTRDTLIQEAMERCGVLRLNRNATSDQLASLGRSLNLIVKSAQGDGLQLFTYRDAFLFLAYGTKSYSLGSTGRAVESYVKSQLSGDEAAAQTVITLDSVTGFLNTNAIGIELDDGTLEWTTINGAPVGNDVTLTAALSGPASEGNWVFSYATPTALIQRPLGIADLFLRDTSDHDSPVALESISEYRMHTDKTTRGPMISAAFDPQLLPARLLVWPTAQDVTDVLAFVYKKPVDDFDAAGDNPAFPVDWQEWLVAEMCVLVSNKFSLPLNERTWFEGKAQSQREKLLDIEDGASISIVPGRR